MGGFIVPSFQSEAIHLLFNAQKTREQHKATVFY